jgi:uroporphyrinogen III methyltransferase/synthase
VVRLKGGDPYVFGRGGEEAEVLAAEGIPFEVIPGVTSGLAAMAWAGIPVTHRREAVRVTLLTAHEAVKSDGPQVRWDLLAADEHATIIGYMGVTALPAVVEQLLAAGMSPAMPAAMVELGTTAGQRSVISTIGDLVQAAAAADLGPPALFAIGPTVRHADRLDWFSRLPLAGERVIVPTGHPDLLGVLEAAGAEVVEAPLPVTPAARVVIGALPVTAVVVSDRGEVDWLHEEREVPGWSRATVIWCLGEAAYERARERGWTNLRRIEEGLDCADLVACIAATHVDA